MRNKLSKDKKFRSTILSYCIITVYSCLLGTLQSPNSVRLSPAGGRRHGDTQRWGWAGLGVGGGWVEHLTSAISSVTN